MITMNSQKLVILLLLSHIYTRESRLSEKSLQRTLRYLHTLGLLDIPYRPNSYKKKLVNI